METIDPDRCAVLTLSMTAEILAGYLEADALIERAAGVLDAARAAGVPVIHGIVQFRAGHPEIGDESPFVPFRDQGRALEGSDSVAPHPALGPGWKLAKRRVSAFSGTDLDPILRAQGRSTLFLMGMRTGGAVLHTACWAVDLDYRIAIVSDCCADPDGSLHQTLVERFFPTWGSVTAAELRAALAAGTLSAAQ